MESIKLFKFINFYYQSQSVKLKSDQHHSLYKQKSINLNMNGCSRRPLMVVNIYVNQNKKSQLPIYAQKPFKWSVRQFAKQHHLKDQAIPYIRDIILSQMKKNKIDVSSLDESENCQNSIIQICKPKSNKHQQKCKIKRVVQSLNEQSSSKRKLNFAQLKSKHTSSMYINQVSTQLFSDIQHQKRGPQTSRYPQTSRNKSQSLKTFSKLKNSKSMKNISNKKIIPNNSKEKPLKSTAMKKQLKTLKVIKTKTLTQTQDSTIAISSRHKQSKDQFSIAHEKSMQSETEYFSLFPIAKKVQVIKSEQKDLQQRMAQQIKQVQIKKLVQKHQKVILRLYQKLIRRNPPSIRRIHADYISFQQVTQQQLFYLQNFFESMTHNQLNQLTYGNFLNLLVKYNAEDLVFSLQDSCLK